MWEVMVPLQVAAVVAAVAEWVVLRLPALEMVVHRVSMCLLVLRMRSLAVAAEVARQGMG